MKPATCLNQLGVTTLLGPLNIAFNDLASGRHRRLGAVKRASTVQCKAKDGSPASSNGSMSDENELWQAGAFPQYMQPNPVGVDFCADWEEAKAKQGIISEAVEHSKANSTLWRSVIRETEQEAKAEPLLSSSLYASILSHDTFEHALAFVLANRLHDATMLSTELFELFYSVLKGSKKIADAALADLCAVRERDPACSTYAQALLYFKGYHAIQLHRIAHELWKKKRTILALALQSRSSEVFAVDIHPAARVGRGVLLDHGTGVVIGETAEIGNNVSILQNVTLGGTGKQHGDRHPKISDNVLIGASATILGNIRIGMGAQVAAGSLVLKAVPPKTMVAGSPAKQVGVVSGNPALKMEQWNTAERKLLNLKEDDCDIFKPTASNGVAVPAAVVASVDEYATSSTDEDIEEPVVVAAAAVKTEQAPPLDDDDKKNEEPKDVEYWI